MSKCDLEIVLDRPDRTYRPGEKISGFVGVTVNRDCRCQGITLTREWRTHGSGNKVRGDADTLRLAEGDLKAGEQQLHPFELVAPPGPLTYHGHHLNVDWYLTARADIPWAVDPKTEEELVLVPGDLTVYHGPAHRPGTDASHPANRAILTGVGVMFALVSGGIGCFALGTGVPMGLEVLPFVLVPLVFTGAGGFLVFMAWRNHLAERRLGPVRLEVTPTGACEGDEVEVAVVFTPTRSVQVEKATARLVVEETCVSGSGTNKTTYNNVLHRHDDVLAAGATISRGSETSWRTTLRLPELNAPSFDATSNHLTWKVEVSLALPGWPDWKRTHQLSVRP